jgi:hypothetical protein
MPCKSTQIGNFGTKIYHLATLDEALPECSRASIEVGHPVCEAAIAQWSALLKFLCSYVRLRNLQQEHVGRLEHFFK